MYIGTSYDPTNIDNRVVNIQSQLRVGKGDMTYNDYYVEALVMCLETKFGKEANLEMPPCSQ